MFENQKIILRKINSTILTKPQKINISNPKEKEINNYVKKISMDHREFGHDLTNLALTVFGNSNISQNKSILKAIEIIKANKKNKERSREKSLIKEKKQNNTRVEKNINNDSKKMKGFGGKYLEKKKFCKKNDINKSKNSSRLNNLEKNKFDNINTISEFKLDNEQNDNKENIQKNQKNEYINKIRTKHSFFIRCKFRF